MRGNNEKGLFLIGYSPHVTDGCFIFTSNVPKGTYEVGIILVRSPSLIAKGIREIHFVQAIKVRK